MIKQKKKSNIVLKNRVSTGSDLANQTKCKRKKRKENQKKKRTMDESGSGGLKAGAAGVAEDAALDGEVDGEGAGMDVEVASSGYGGEEEEEGKETEGPGHRHYRISLECVRRERARDTRMRVSERVEVMIIIINKS